MASEIVRVDVRDRCRCEAHPTGPRRNAAGVAAVAGLDNVLARSGAGTGSRGITGGVARAARTGAFDADRAGAAFGGVVQATEAGAVAIGRRAGPAAGTNGNRER